MKRVFAKIGLLGGSRGFLKFFFWTITLIVLFYAEEDWRGARSWAAIKAKWEARGETFEFTKLIPPPVPAAQNLADLPLFSMGLDPSGADGADGVPLDLQAALGSNRPGRDLPKIGNLQKGDLPNMKEIREKIAAEYGLVFKTPSPVSNSLAQFNALYPFVSALREASKARPYCRFQEDYESQPPYGRSLLLVTAQLRLAHVLALDAVLALAAHQTETALGDIEVGLKLSAGISHEPILISGLVACGMNAMMETAIYEGLALHDWNDAELAQLQDDLNSFDFLADDQLSTRGELAGFSLPTLEYFKKQRPDIGNFFTSQSPTPIYDRSAIFAAWPDGWLDCNQAQITDVLLESVNDVDPKLHRAYPERSDQAKESVHSFARKWFPFAPWNIFYSLAAEPILGATVQFSQAQVGIDEARIACALERYRLIHGNYPASLDSLAPVCVAKIPNDVINGEPYHYRILSNGGFLLYSVGWNNNDDGGVIVFTVTDPNDSPMRHGDWVWRAPK